MKNNASNRRALAYHCLKAIRSVWTLGNEPRSVFEIFCTKSARTAWSQALNNLPFNVRYSSVFVHQRPYVSFLDQQGHTKKCEIGDVLIVASFPDRKRRRAMLLQAKMLNSVVSWPPLDKQWDLYNRWPLFSYSVGQTHRSAVTMPAQRALSRAQYLFLPKWPCPFVMPAKFTHTRTVVPWQMCLHSHFLHCATRGIPLAFLIADLLREDAGSAFPFKCVHGMSGWCQLVWDLLKVTACQNAPIKQIGASPGTKRGNLLMFASHGDDSADIEDAPGEDENSHEGFVVVEFRVGGRNGPDADDIERIALWAAE